MTNKIIIGKHSFNTAVAITEQEQSLGLMYQRKPMVMCFPFEKSAIHKFWMKNTLIPLDIVFCKNNKVASIHKGIPLSEEFVGPNFHTDFVAELPFGTVKEKNISIGDSVSLIYSVDTLAKKLANKFSHLTFE